MAVGPAAELDRALNEASAGRERPLIVALDGHSGVGKSTLAAAVAEEGRVTVIEGDDFYAGGSGSFWDMMSAREKAAHCIDWRRQHQLLSRLRAGGAGLWRPFDWEAFDGSLSATVLRAAPTSVVILEGVYSARPELAEVVDLRVLVRADPEVRHRRLVAREGEAYADDWFARWTEAEELYFGEIMPPQAFDLVLEAGG